MEGDGILKSSKALAFVVIATLALLMPVLGLAFGRSEVRRSDENVQVIRVKADPPGSPRTLRRLTDRQRRQAKRILARDKRFRAIIDPATYRFVEIVPWGVLDERPRRQREVFIGTFSRVVLSAPKPSVVADWPLLDYPRDEVPNYRVTTLWLTVSGLRSMTVNVDLKRRTVAGFSPLRADAVVYPPDYKPPPPTPD